MEKHCGQGLEKNENLITGYRNEISKLDKTKTSPHHSNYTFNVRALSMTKMETL